MFVDSGAFIALFSGDDHYHTMAAELFRQCKERRTRLFTTQLVVAEVHRWLLFTAGIAAALIAVDNIDASSAVAVEYTTADHHRAALEWLHELDDQEITYADAVSFAIMSAKECEVVLGFDQDFVLAGFTHLRADML